VRRHLGAGLSRCNPWVDTCLSTTVSSCCEGDMFRRPKSRIMLRRCDQVLAQQLAFSAWRSPRRRR
jgi:hypothetical protein